MRSRLFTLFFSLIILAASAWLLGGCGSPTNAPVTPPQAAATTAKTSLTVFAAASLTESFTEMAAAFESAWPEADVILNFAGSNTLRLQIEQGAPADIFASANVEQMDALVTSRLVNKPLIFAHNQLVVIVPVANPGHIKTLADLVRPQLKLVLAGPDVPVGAYARQVLTQLNNNPELGPDFAKRVLNNLVSEEETVKAVVTKVQLGEADAGIVYTSDITPAVADQLTALAIPTEFNIVADYPIAVTANSAQPALAQQFIDFVLSPSGQTILARHGFQPLVPFLAEH